MTLPFRKCRSPCSIMLRRLDYIINPMLFVILRPCSQHRDCRTPCHTLFELLWYNKVMIRWLILSIIIFAVVLTADDAKSIGDPVGRNVPHAESGEPLPPAVYFSTLPNTCVNFSGNVYWVYVHSPANDDLNYVSFDIDFEGYGISPPPLVSPASGVFLGNFDVSDSPYHFEAAWTPRTLEHEQIIKVYYLSDPSVMAMPVNVVFGTTQGATVPGFGVWSLTCCADLFDCFVSIYAPKHARVLIGETTIIPFQWEWNCWASGGGSLTASDTEGWITSWAPTSAGDYATFGLCIAPRHDGWIEVYVPSGIAAGATSQLTISGAGYADIILEADDGTPVESTSWGNIKAKYR